MIIKLVLQKQFRICDKSYYWFAFSIMCYCRPISWSFIFHSLCYFTSHWNKNIRIYCKILRIVKKFLMKLEEQLWLCWKKITRHTTGVKRVFFLRVISSFYCQRKRWNKTLVKRVQLGNFGWNKNFVPENFGVKKKC